MLWFMFDNVIVKKCERRLICSKGYSEQSLYIKFHFQIFVDRYYCQTDIKFMKLFRLNIRCGGGLQKSMIQ